MAGVQEIAKEYRSRTRDIVIGGDRLHGGFLLGINDISLPFGGGFDIGGRWAEDITVPLCRLSGRGHCEHRDGKDVDIDINIELVTQEGKRIVRTVPCSYTGRLALAIKKLSEDEDNPINAKLRCEEGGFKHVDFN